MGEHVTTPEVTKVSVGDVLDGKYRILRPLGRGAWGNVFEGVNDRIGRRLAIKILHPEYVERRDMLERFEREARTATKIESEHVVRVFDLGALKDGRPYIVMEFLDGEDLGQHLARVKKVSAVMAAILGIQALRGLAEAHAEGILHRDIKPDNIVLVKTRTSDRVVKIVDFGISKLGGSTDMSMTATGAVLGSPMYMSPEQCRGAKQIDARSDLYSLGVVLYEAVSGRMPYEADSFNELMFKIALEEAPSPRIYEPELDTAFAGIITRALKREADKRFHTAEDFEKALAGWLESQGVQEVDWRLAASATGSKRWTSTGPRPSDDPATRSGTGPVRVPPELQESQRQAIARATGGGLAPGAAKALGLESTSVPDAPASEPALTSSSTPVAPRRSKAGVYAIALLVALGGIGFVVKQRSDAHDRSAKPADTTVATTEPAPPASALLPTPPAAVPVAPPPVEPAASEPAAAEPAPERIKRPSGRRSPHASDPRTSSAAPAAVPSPTPPTTAPTGSAGEAQKGVVEGRTVRTKL
jgi:serine/threonine-protein kinase